MIRRKKKGLKSKCPESNNPAIRYDKRSYTVWLDREEVSLATISGRQRFKVNIPEYFKQYLDWETTSANLKYDKKHKKFFLNVTVKKDLPGIKSVNFRVGVDLGLRKLAVVSTPDGKINKFFDDRHVRAVSERYYALRKRLQAKGTPSAKRDLKKISQKEKRFRACINHLNASRNIVKDYLTSLQKEEVGAGDGISSPVGCTQPAYCSGVTQHQLQAPSRREE